MTRNAGRFPRRRAIVAGERPPPTEFTMAAGDDKRWHEVLECAAKMGVAVWIRSPDGKVCHVNHRAEVLLGRPATDFLGKPCHRALSTRDASGNAFCAPACPVLRRVQGHAEIPPVDLRVDLVDGTERWLRVLVLPYTASHHRGPYLVHCALCIDAERRVRGFVQHLATRSHHAREHGVGAVGDPALNTLGASTEGLTPRELQVLDRLAEDRSLHEIAAELGVAYTTVRNHVQHILPKLHAHSILEAVAVHVLATPGPGEMIPSDPSPRLRGTRKPPGLMEDPSASRTSRRLR